MGAEPKLVLPMYNFSNNSYIQGFGQITPTDDHNGIDFGINATTEIMAPHDAYIDNIRTWYNEKGGHWQTNVELWLSFRWYIEIIFESWALNESFGKLQRDAIVVTRGQYVQANQTLGNLLYHGAYAHIHFGIKTFSTDLCPYTYFSSAAKTAFENQFPNVNTTLHWCM